MGFGSVLIVLKADMPTLSMKGTKHCPGWGSAALANCSAALPTGKLVTKRIVAGALLIPLAMPAWTDFQDGLEAAQRGDFETAFREWQPLSEQGNAEAQFSLGFMYRRGDGVPQDYVQAHMWWRSSAA
jgi:TPR repeat protein